MDNTWRFKTIKFRRSASLLEIVRVLLVKFKSKAHRSPKSKKAHWTLKTLKSRNPNKNRSMDHNVRFKAILIKYRCPFVVSLFQKRPSCFPKRCSLLGSQRVNENARVIRRSLPMSLFEPCPTSSGLEVSHYSHEIRTANQIRRSYENNQSIIS